MHLCLTLIFATFWLSASAQEKPCECLGTVMNCFAKGKTTFGPKDYCPGKIKRLALNQNRIASLPANAFSGLRDLEWLVLDKNNLTTLPKGIFNGLTKLTTLSISANSLSSLPEGVFNGADKIEILALDNNKLTTLPRRLFTSLQSLKQIGLGLNPLRNIPNDLFSGLNKINFVDLTENGISVLPTNLFKDIKKMEHLHLSFNKLKTITSNDLRGIESVENLWLDSNEMAALPKYDSSWPKVQRAFLYGNKIEDVTEPVLRSWLESGGRVQWLVLATPTITPLRNPSSLQWILTASGVTTTVSSDCRCGMLRKAGTAVSLCLAVDCGGPNQPANWVEAVRATVGGGSAANGRKKGRVVG